MFCQWRCKFQSPKSYVYVNVCVCTPALLSYKNSLMSNTSLKHILYLYYTGPIFLKKRENITNVKHNKQCKRSIMKTKRKKAKSVSNIKSLDQRLESEEPSSNFTTNVWVPGWRGYLGNKWKRASVRMALINRFCSFEVYVFRDQKERYAQKRYQILQMYLL